MSVTKTHTDENTEVIFSNTSDADSDNEKNDAVDENVSSATSSNSEKGHSSDESLKDDQPYNRSRKKNFRPKVKIKTLTIDGQLVYFCKICDKIFTRRKDKLNHELAHSGESVLICNECGKEYLHESSLASHMRTHDGDPLYMCDLCPKMFAQSHHLKSHILSHSEPTSFVCKTCYMEFATSADLNHHCRIQIKLEMSKHWCKMCKIYLCRSHSCSKEQRLHAFICSACNEFFYTNKKLKIHMKKFAHFSTERKKCIKPLEEYELYPFKVTENLRRLSTQKEMEAMKKTDKSEIPYKPSVDEISEDELPTKKFTFPSRKIFLEEENSSTSLQDSVSEIKVEIDLKSPNKQRKGKPYCKKCNRSFKDVLDLERHKAQSHKEHDLQESSPLTDVDRAKNELISHSLEGSHSCPMCGENFTCSLELTKHLKSHTDELSHKCSHCSKGFKHKVQLLQHIHLHLTQDTQTHEPVTSAKQDSASLAISITSQDGNFKCHLCNRIFYFRSHLLNHLHLHTKVKCFQCYICSKAFATKYYLQRHLQVHAKQGIDVDVNRITVVNNDLRFQNERDTKMLSTTQNHPQGWHSGMDDLLRFSEQPFINGIKIEPLQESDSGSETSSRSDITRDSERSDPFRFSSDESNSFKTTMAKERRRLKRRWRQISKQVQPMKRLKEEDDGCLAEDGDEGNDEDITDMMVELNGVQSEVENMLTVYVDLTHMKKAPVNDKNTDLDVKQVIQSNMLDNNEINPEMVVKKEVQEVVEPTTHDGMIGETQTDINKNVPAQSLNQLKISCENTIQTQTCKENLIITHCETIVSEIKTDPEPPSQNRYMNTYLLSSTSENKSNLEKLKVAFEGPSKFLPTLDMGRSPCPLDKGRPLNQSDKGLKTDISSASNRNVWDICLAKKTTMQENASPLDPHHLDIDRPLVIDIPPNILSPKMKPPCLDFFSTNSTNVVANEASTKLPIHDVRFKIQDKPSSSLRQASTSNSMLTVSLDKESFTNQSPNCPPSSKSHHQSPATASMTPQHYVASSSSCSKAPVTTILQSSQTQRQFSQKSCQSQGQLSQQKSNCQGQISQHGNQMHFSLQSSQGQFSQQSSQGQFSQQSSQGQFSQQSSQGQFSQQSSQGQFSLNVSSIFDTNNPVLRDMNMLDLVSQSHSVSSAPAPHASGSLPGSTFNVIHQNSIQPFNNSMYSQNLSVHPPHSYPGVSMSLCDNMSPFDSVQAGPSITNLGLGAIQGNNLSLHLRNLHSIPVQIDYPFGRNISMLPTMPVQMNLQQLPFTQLPYLPHSAPYLDGTSGVGPNNADPAHFFGGTAFAMNSGTPLSISTNPVLIGSSLNNTIIGSFTGSADSLGNPVAPLGLGLMNQPLVVPNINSLLQGHPITMLNNMNPGYFQFP